MEFKLGQRLHDPITGLEGIATGFCTYITGCDQYLIQPARKKDGEVADSRWVDEDRLELVVGGDSVFTLPGVLRRANADAESARRVPGPDKPAPIR